MSAMKSFTLALCVAAAAVNALPSATSHVRHEKRGLEHEHITADIVARADGDILLPVRIAMTPSNLDKGHNILMDISHHESSNYGRYLSVDEINAMFAPSQEAVDMLFQWLESEGIERKRVSQSYNKQFVQFDAPVAELEKLVKAEYNIYEHESGKAHVGCEEYSIPHHLVEHIDYITPGVTRLGLKTTSRKRDVPSRTNAGIVRPPPSPTPYTGPPINMQNAGNLTNCDSVITPACLFALYNVTQGTLKASGNKLGIFETELQYYRQEDLNDYFSHVYDRIPRGTSPEVRLIDGAPSPGTYSGVEAVLDFEISYPLIWPQNSVLYAVDDEWYQANDTNYETGKYLKGFLNTFLDGIDGSYCSYEAYGAAVPSPLDPSYPDPAPDGYKGQLQCGVFKPTNVISISYGFGEGDLPPKYFKRQCDEYMKLGMQGVTVVVASGDSGVASRYGDQSENGCLSLNPNKNKPGRIFSSEFPVACPYILAVGSTTLPAGSKAQMGSEVSTDQFGSGGGFSNVFPRPSYQQAAVDRYLRNYPPQYLSYNISNGETIGENGGIFNIAGRAFPDVSALGQNGLLWFYDSPNLIGGTSMSAPIVAALINRINEERIALGKKTVGFVNPTFYAHPEIFQDVTKGNNPGCGTRGFSSVPGFDPVSGLGTPNYGKMLNLFKSLP